MNSSSAFNFLLSTNNIRKFTENQTAYVMKILFSILISIALISFSCTGTGEKGNGDTGPGDSLVIEHLFPYQDLHCHGSSIAELPNKDLMVAWFHGSGERTADDVAIMGSRRDHISGQWSEPFILADVPDFPDINPVLFVDNKEQLWLVWYTVMAYQWESSVLKYRISDNYMQKTGPPEWKWQDMIHIKADGTPTEGINSRDPFVENLKAKYEEYYTYLDTSGFFEIPGNESIKGELWNRALERYFKIARGESMQASGMDINEDGEKFRSTLGYPMARRTGWQTRNKPLFYADKMLLPLYSDGFDFSLIAITGDNGLTWDFSEPLVGAGCIQPALGIRKDGSIAAFMRDNGPAPKRLMQSMSADTGKSWSVVTDSEIPNPGSAADLVVLKSGNWVIVGNDTEAGRHRLTLYLSKDEGKTWPIHKSIVNDVHGSPVRAHYPAIIEGSDGRIHVSYTNQIGGPEGQGTIKNIAVASFMESWLLD